ncbi:MAG TPA: PAS domain S-box protein, partial [Bacillota bacterium]|nr:PAS domain S-box protein [Bacillota bacterium]
ILIGKQLGAKGPSRKTWYSLEPQFSLCWSKLRSGLILECSNPVIVNGVVIGHVYSTITFLDLIKIIWSFIAAILISMAVSWWIALLTNRRITNRIKNNLNLLLLDGFSYHRDFNYHELDAIYHKNFQVYLNLQRSEKQKSDMLVNCPWGYMILDSKGHFIEMNEKGASCLGYSRQDFIGTSLEKWRASLPFLFQTLSRGIKSEGKAQVFNPILKEERILYICSFPVVMNNGEEGLMTWFVDITEQVRAQEVMERSNRKMNNILESISDAFFTVDQNLCYTYLNKSAEKLLYGGERQNFIGKAATQVLPDYDSKTFIELLNHVYLENEPIRYETYSETKDNWVEVSVFPIEDGLAVFASDISNRKRLEKALLEERERYLITLGSIGDGVIATNSQGQIVLMNEAAERLTGYNAQCCVGRALKRVFYVIDDKTSEPFTGTLNKVLFSGVTFYADQAVLVTQDLMEVPIAFSCAPIKNSFGQIIGAVIVFKDLSERLKTEMELQKTQKLESLGILAGGIAHDFNNLLAAILLNTELALHLWQKGENIQKLLTQTISTTYKARNLSAQLLTFSKGGAPIKKTMSIKDLLKETVSFVLRGSSINCVYEIASDLQLVEIDEGQIVQVLNNLIINAKQAMPRGGTITVSARNVDKTTEQPRGKSTTYIEIAIKDQGIGIPKEYLQKIYDPFFSTKSDGTGLGLATTYSIIKRHGGLIEVESQVNSGTTFRIYLPASAQTTVESLAHKEVAASSRKLKILIMDDEEGIRNSVGEMLLNYGYDVVTSADGQETIILYKQSFQSGEPFDVVIMDLTITGGMGGQETIAHLRDIDPKIKAIVSSGYANDRVLSEYERYGFKGIVEKPYTIGTLIEVIDQVTKQQ